MKKRRAAVTACQRLRTAFTWAWRWQRRGDKAGARREIESALRLSAKASFPEADEARKALATL